MSDVAYITIFVNDENDNPIVFSPSPGVTPNYCEDQAPAPIFIGSISDLDSLDYYALSVRISDPYDIGDELLDVDLTGVAALKYYDVSTYTLFVIGTLSPYIYSTILSDVVYENVAKEFGGRYRNLDIYFETDEIPNIPDIDLSHNYTTNSTELVEILVELQYNVRLLYCCYFHSYYYVLINTGKQQFTEHIHSCIELCE